MENLFGTYGGVIQCVKGMRFSVSSRAFGDWCRSHVVKRTFPEWMALRPRSRSFADTAIRPLEEVDDGSRARRMPLSSKSSRIALVR